MKILATVLCITLASVLLLGGGLASAQSSLGDPDQLVLKSVKPCRIIDTRPAGVPFATAETRSYDVYGNVANQNGYGLPGSLNPQTCPAPKGEPRAVSINVTAVPGSATGHLRVWTARPAVGILEASMVNFAGKNIANQGSVKTWFAGGAGNPDLKIFASAPTHVVADVTGYYYDVDDVFISEDFQDAGGAVNFDPTQQLKFLVQPAQVVVTRPNQNIFVTSQKAFGSTNPGGARGLRLAICYDGPGIGNAQPVGGFVTGLAMGTNSGNPDQRQLQGLSAMIMDLQPPFFPATYDVGLCGRTTTAAQAANWDYNGRGYTTAFVVEDKQ